MTSPMPGQCPLQPKNLIISANAANDTVIDNAIQALASLNSDGRRRRCQIHQNRDDILAGHCSHIQVAKHWLQAFLNNEN